MPKSQEGLFTNVWERCRGTRERAPKVKQSISSREVTTFKSRAKGGSGNGDANGESHLVNSDVRMQPVSGDGTGSFGEWQCSLPPSSFWGPCWLT